MFNGPETVLLTQDITIGSLELDAIYGRTTVISAKDFVYDEANDEYTYSSGQFDDQGDEIKVTYK